jgi:putative transposase
VASAHAVTAYGIISAEKARTSVSVTCELLGVSRSGYHAWACRAPADRHRRTACLLERIKQIHAENRRVYGSRRQAELHLSHGIVVSRKRVQRLIRAAGIAR